MLINRFTKAQTVIMGDVTYGACCVDDYTARALGADLMVHYGHSCLGMHTKFETKILRKNFPDVLLPPATVPVDQTSIRTLYVFVEIAIDPDHVCATIRTNFPALHSEFQESIIEAQDRAHSIEKPKMHIDFEENDDRVFDKRPTHLVLVATVQFINSLHALKDRLEHSETREQFFDVGSSNGVTDIGQKLLASEGSRGEPKPVLQSFWHSSPYRITIPQVKPLSAGEILGCTSPKLDVNDMNGIDGIIYVGDGRFHLESIMISNPSIPAFRYDPYEKRFVREMYDHSLMRTNRNKAVEEAKQSLAFEVARKEQNDSTASQTKGWGLILGTLGRQGSTRVLNHLRTMMTSNLMPSIPILLSELSPQKIALFGPDLVTYVQTSCPRLSIDWGDAFPKPLLSPYEAAVALGKARGWHVPSKDIGSSQESSQGMSFAKRDALAQNKQEDDYPMDFYADGSLGPWTPRHGMGTRKGNSKGISNRELLRRGRKVGVN